MKKNEGTSEMLEDNIASKWISEMRQIIGASKIKDPIIEARILEHLEKSEVRTNSMQTRSLFFLLDNTLVKYLFVSRSVEKVLGYSSEEIVRKGFEWLFTMLSEEELQYKKSVMADLYQFLKTLDRESILNCTVRYDLVLERNDGRKVHLLEEMMYPEVSEKGEPLISSCFLHDIDNYGEKDKRHCKVYLGSAGFEEVIYAKTYYIDHKNSSPLSIRETEILDQFSKGFTTTQVADKLFISENTVKTHRKNILFKLQVLNTAEAIRICLTNNWLS